MKILKWILIVIAALGVIAYFWYQHMISETKKHSPQDHVEYKVDRFKISVDYCRPYKKGREIFGGLVPYNEVWRTGANEATVVETSQEITFGTKKLAAGKYTLWTIPQQTQWTIILNSKQYGWGVNWNGEAARDPNFDVLKINVPQIENENVVEQFTIRFEYNVNMILEWDNSKVSIPIQF